MKRMSFAIGLAAVAAAVSADTLTWSGGDGTPFANDGKWRLILTDSGRKLKFGPMRGTQILLK